MDAASNRDRDSADAHFTTQLFDVRPSGGDGGPFHLVWLKHSVEETFQTVATALQHQARLERNLQTAISDSPNSSNKVNRALVEARQSATETRKFLNTLLNSIPVTRRPTPSSAIKAEQVFSTPELLEGIVTELDVHDLLSALQVNRTTAAMASTSPRLKDMLHLCPTKSGHLQTNFGGPDNANSYPPHVQFRNDHQYISFR